MGQAKALHSRRSQASLFQRALVVPPRAPAGWLVVAPQNADVEGAESLCVCLLCHTRHCRYDLALGIPAVEASSSELEGNLVTALIKGTDKFLVRLICTYIYMYIHIYVYTYR